MQARSLAAATTPAADARAPAETFFEPHAQLRLPRASLKVRATAAAHDCCCANAPAERNGLPRSAQDAAAAAGPSWATNLSGVFATLHSKAALLLAEEALPAAAADGDGVLGSGLLAMNRVATVVGTALDSFVEVRGWACLQSAIRQLMPANKCREGWIR